MKPKAKTYSKESSEKALADTMGQRLNGAPSGVAPPAKPGASTHTYTPQIKPKF